VRQTTPRWAAIGLGFLAVVGGESIQPSLLDAAATPTMIGPATASQRAIRETPTIPSGDNVVWALGDIAECDGKANDDAVGKFLQGTVGPILLLGDIAYQSGSLAELQNCFDPAWGPLRPRWRPVPGNHEYTTPDAAGYYTYFGAAAADPTQGYYSYEVAGWHVVALNSNCGRVGGCQVGSPQEKWLRADLAAHPVACTLAYWHHPRFSSGEHRSNPAYTDLWQALYDAGAEIVLNGHDHNYERFAPQTPTGVYDFERGLREFVVGTGGANLRVIDSTAPNSQLHDDTTFGPLALTLQPGSYKWQFVRVAGVGTLDDRGTGICH
jgi:acid phosphatase type 7